jgi:hypothetical protein
VLTLCALLLHVLPLLLHTPGRINKTVAATDDALAQRKQAEHDAAVAAAMAAAQAARQRLRAKKHRKKDEVTRQTTLISVHARVFICT